MPNIFKDMLSSDETLFKNPVALDLDYIPKLIPYRENEQFKIAGCIKPLFQQRNGYNLIITGRPGVGKTVACKHVIQELEEQTDDIHAIYINCWQKNTSYKIMLTICELFEYKFVQNKKTDELFNIIKQILNKKSAVIIFDEIDKVEEFDFLYMFLEEIYRKTIILITNFKDWIMETDERIKSRLMPSMIEFLPYKHEETKGILKHRKDNAFIPNTWPEECFEAVVRKTVEEGDIRSGLFLLREAAQLCEDESLRKVQMKHVESAIEKLANFSIKKSTDLEEDLKFILKVIKANSDKKIGDLFVIYQSAGGKSAYKTFQRKIKKLEDSKMISVKKTSGGPEGNTTIVSFSKQPKLTDY